MHTILTSCLISFADISARSMFQDINKLIVGIIMMFIYIQIVVSKFNMVECRVSSTVVLFLVLCIPSCVHVKKSVKFCSS
jgi:putative effector of murein hydrolase LrgA (UPF0299 family)